MFEISVRPRAGSTLEHYEMRAGRRYEYGPPNVPIGTPASYLDPIREEHAKIVEEQKARRREIPPMPENLQSSLGQNYREFWNCYGELQVSAPPANAEEAAARHARRCWVRRRPAATLVAEAA